MIVNVSVRPAPRTAPVAAAGLLDGERLAPALRFDAHDVPREIAQQVAAWDPRRQREPLLVGRVLDAAFDLEPVPIEVGQANAIADQSWVPSARGARRKTRGIVA